jgi:hypothetical protein
MAGGDLHADDAAGALQTDDAAEARKHASLALRILAGAWDQAPDADVRMYARRQLEAMLVSLRSLLAQPDLPSDVERDARQCLLSFWDA